MYTKLLSIFALLYNPFTDMPGTTTTAPWRARVEQALATGPQAKEFCISTSTPTGPRARFVGFQSFTPSDYITIATDRDSHKVNELSSDANVEIAWYVPRDGVQFRIRGVAAPIGEAYEFDDAKSSLGFGNEIEGSYDFWRKERERVYKSMGPRAATYNHSTPPGVPVPEGTDNAHFNFMLLAVRPQHVEVLDLLTHTYTTSVRVPGGWREGRPLAPGEEEEVVQAKL